MRTTQTTIEGKGAGAVAPPLSGAGAFRTYYDSATGQLMLSVNGGAYAAIAGTGVAQWEHDGLGQLRPTNRLLEVQLRPLAAAASQSSQALNMEATTVANVDQRWTLIARPAADLGGGGAEETGIALLTPDAGQIFVCYEDQTSGDRRIVANTTIRDAQGLGAAVHAAIAGGYTIDDQTDPTALQFTTAGAGAQNVDLPPEAAGLHYVIQNNVGSPGNINVRDDAAGAVATLTPGQLVILRSSDAAWFVFGPWSIP